MLETVGAKEVEVDYITPAEFIQKKRIETFKKKYRRKLKPFGKKWQERSIDELFLIVKQAEINNIIVPATAVMQDVLKIVKKEV